MIVRALEPSLAATRRSVLLIGPRQTGKSTLMARLAPDLSLNLFHEPTFLEFARNPNELEERLAALPRLDRPLRILIDEVQRLPSLLNTVQVLIDRHDRRYRFLLTGSSARKLRRGNANLLPGRVHVYHLGPITAAELDYQLDTLQALSVGTLPGILSDASTAEQQKTLRSYAATYLKEEVQAENLSRNLEGFARFLTLAAEWAGHHLDLTKVAAASQVARQSVARYFEVLEDTLIVHRVAPFSSSLSRRLVQHPKFYFFDVGVRNGLLRSFDVGADRIGLLFEQLIASQILAAAAAKDLDLKLSTYRTEHGAEVDFIVEHSGATWAVELKASRHVNKADLRGLRSFAEYHGNQHTPLILYLGSSARHLDGIDVLPWQQGLQRMGL